MIQLMAFRKTARPIKVAALVTRMADAVRSVVAPQTMFTTPAPVVTTVVEPDPDTSEFFTPDEMPAAEDIEAACSEFYRAADAVRAGERTKRRTKKLLGRLQSGTYGGWTVERTESSRSTVDLDAVRKIFRQHGLGPVPMKASAPSLLVTRVESDALSPSATDQEFAALAAAMTR